MNSYTGELNLPVLLAVLALVLPQSIMLFIDARRRKANAWFWGIWGATTFPLPTILYLFFVRKIFSKKKNK